MNKKLVILDSNSLLNRAFYALPPMTNSKGLPTGAIYGFTNMLLKILNDIKPDYIAATFDKSKITFRHSFYEDYKAGRKKMPDELAVQFEPVKKVLSAFGINTIELQNFEADDLIGTISKKFESPECDVIIYTGDRDALQLVSEYTKIMITKKGITEIDVYDLGALKEKYGFEPWGIIELKGLMGDASDNIPGVPGVGEKTALKLLEEYKTIENIYNNIDNISGKKVKENLILNKDSAILSKKLATIDRDVPLEINIDDLGISGYDPKAIKDLFLEYEFKSLIEKIKPVDSKAYDDETALPEITGSSDLKEIISRIEADKVFNFIFTSTNRICDGFIVQGGNFISIDKVSEFKEQFESDEIIKNTNNAKYAYTVLMSNGIFMRNLGFDTEIASYLLNPTESTYEISDMLFRYCNINVSSHAQEDKIKIESLYVDKLSDIKDKMNENLEKLEMVNLYYNIEMPLVEVLAHMEIQGFKVNENTLKQIGFELSEDIDKLTMQIHDIAGEEFNINSPKQLGVILFEKLGLPVIKKTKTGYSTDAEVLEDLSSQSEIVEKILNYRQLVKLKSTYIDGLLVSIGRDGKIHSSFNQTVTATGRISSTEPNLQNIPIKFEQGRRIRKAFIPSSEDKILLSADYSQIELRVLAHISNDAGLINSFIVGEDIHTRTASEVFDIPMEEVQPLQRSRAKAVNFGIIYGLSDYGLSRDLKISRKEAKSYIDNYFDRYRQVQAYLESAINEGRENGCVKTLFKRIRYIPEINSQNRNTRMFGERLAMNTPIQGTAADIIKIAMVNVHNRLEKEGLKSKIILQVHDELVLEVEKDELDAVKNIVKYEMENAVKLSVPLVVDIKWGNNWYEAK